MKSLLLLLFSFLYLPVFCQQHIDGESIHYRIYKKRNSQEMTNFAVKFNPANVDNIEGILYKYNLNGWDFIYAKPALVSDLLEVGTIQQIYFNPAKPSLLNDTMRIVQNIDSVHFGSAPLSGPFTGEGVIMGYVDSGIDHSHEDFKNADGSTRILYYWDHTLGFDLARTPVKYGYGQVWSSADINAGICLSSDGTAHGTTVAGAGSGNGRATGTHKGVAPNADIIMVETNFSLANWTLTVADAIDFMFAIADSLGKPVVVNTSVGSYLGSHDGTDPASQVIDSLLNAKPGRIVVAAAGNSGSQGKYHVKATVTSDTSFCWMKVNPTSAFDVPATYFDLWADTAAFKAVKFAFGADKKSPNYSFRGRTDFYSITDILGVSTYDTIFSPDGFALSPVELYAEEINGVYHMEMLMLNPDSATYNFRFETVGEGLYDLWSGEWVGGSDFLDTPDLPSEIDFPAIAYYHLPDTLSTVVSSWSCSPKVVTVGNFKNQYDYIDYNGNPYVLSGGPAGELSPNSSKGPNRLGHIKPDISATGDGIMSACPLWLSASLKVSNPSMLAAGGQHVRNGGTSMASPVIAGIAALFLEKCPQATYQDFLDALYANAYEDLFTASTPNFAYGYGKTDAFKLLNSTNFDVTLTGSPLICEDPEVYMTVENDFASYHWFNGKTTASISLNEDALVFATVTSAQGCLNKTDTIHVVKGDLPLLPFITPLGGGLISTPADSFVWYFNSVAIDESNSQFHNPVYSGIYNVAVFSAAGCSLLSADYYVDTSTIKELDKNEFIIFPNPFNTHFNIIKNMLEPVNFVLTDISGKIVYTHEEVDSEQAFISVSIPELASGVYILNLFYEKNFKSYKLIKE